MDGLLTAVIPDAQCLPLPGQVSAQLPSSVMEGHMFCVLTAGGWGQILACSALVCSPGTRLGAP